MRLFIRKNLPMHMSKESPLSAQKNKIGGFTLIEVMIVVSMIVIFTAVGLGYSQDAGGQISFFRDQSKFVSEIYRVRAMAIATYQQSGQVCAYGIWASGNTLYVGYVPPPCINYHTALPSSVIFSATTLRRLSGEDVVLADTNITPEASLYSILFTPPYLDVFFNKGGVISHNDASATGCFLLTSTHGGASSVVTIDQTGQVNVRQGTCP